MGSFQLLIGFNNTSVSFISSPIVKMWTLLLEVFTTVTSLFFIMAIIIVIIVVVVIIKYLYNFY